MSGGAEGSSGVLVLGAGGREAALVRALRRDRAARWVRRAPDDDADDTGLADLDPTDPSGIVDAARRLGADLVVVGPEAPLVAGVADTLREAGVAVVGPSAVAVRLESSKAFAKDVMAAAGVPTATSTVVETSSADGPLALAAALARHRRPHVVKDDGLAGGKGVIVTDDAAEAVGHARRCGRVVVEDFLDGPEVSVFVLTDGEAVVTLPVAQDFKRARDGGEGPNTGGMGAYAPVAWAPGGLADDVVERVVRPVLAEMRRRGTPYSGVLYVGLALTADGPRVVEFNCRLGDPEAQAVLPLVRTPLVGLLRAVAEGRLAEHPPLEVDGGAACCVVLAAPGYPDAPVTGGVVGGVAAAGALDGVHVDLAGTRRRDDGALVASGGRVLAVVGRGDDLARARGLAYDGLARLHLDGGHWRTDVAQAAAEGRVRVPQAI